ARIFSDLVSSPAVLVLEIAQSSSRVAPGSDSCFLGHRTSANSRSPSGLSVAAGSCFGLWAILRCFSSDRGLD
ncbi:hypothetical protein AALP_AAs50048U000100, partial [Arabis alpina]